MTATGDDGRSFALIDGLPPWRSSPQGRTASRWSSSGRPAGRLARPDQGGDPDGGWELEPRGRGVAFRYVEMPAGHDPGDAGWHTTATIDLDLDAVRPARARRCPGPSRWWSARGESVVQRATNHRWRPVGDEPVRFVALMLAVGDQAH